MHDVFLDAGLHPCLQLGSLLEPCSASLVIDRGAAVRTVAIDAKLLQVAGRHHMVPALASALRGRRLRASDPELHAYLAAIGGLNARRNHQLQAEVGEIAAAFAGAGVRPVFLKGVALLLRGTYPDPSGRFLGDIDVLVAPEEAEAAAGALERLDFRRTVAGPPHVHDRMKLAHPRRPAQVELHHPAVPGHLAGPLPAAAMRADAVAVPLLPGATVPCATDLVVHNVIHAMLHDWNLRMAEMPMRDALDLALIAREPGVSWEAVEARMARAPSGAAALGFYLAAARETFPSGGSAAASGDGLRRAVAAGVAGPAGSPDRPGAAAARQRRRAHRAGVARPRQDARRAPHGARA